MTAARKNFDPREHADCLVAQMEAEWAWLESYRGGFSPFPDLQEEEKFCVHNVRICQEFHALGAKFEEVHKETETQHYNELFELWDRMIAAGQCPSIESFKVA